jgi:hypothetical protein
MSKRRLPAAINDASAARRAFNGCVPRRRLAWLLFAGCSAHVAAPIAPAPVCTTKIAVHVADEAGAPIAGAQVHAESTVSRCGPSGALEGCSFTPTESPTVDTDATGIAHVCDVAAGRPGRGWVRIEYQDWPARLVPVEAAASITLGPSRSLIVEVPAGCKDMSHVHVTAQAETSPQLWAAPVLGSMRSHRYRLDNLGPWQYWVSNTDDRWGNSAAQADACPSFIRFVDGRRKPSVLVLDRSDTAIEFPDLAGARATLRAFRNDDVIATAILDADGHATVALPTGRGTALCLRLERDDRCMITLARAGEIARPKLYAGRDPAIEAIEASCGRCD